MATTTLGEAEGVEFERLTLFSNVLRVEVIPELGAKISSLWLPDLEEELLQAPLSPYAARTRTMAFEEGDASGIDECIPTVSGCQIGGNLLPDHGDFWRVPFRHWREGEDVVLEADGFSLPLRFSKRLALRENRLSLAYVLRNTGEAPIEFLWSAHPGFAVEAGDKIVLPGSIPEVTVWYSAKSRLGGPGRAHSWPHTRDEHGETIDLSIAGGPEDGVGDKLFAIAPVEGWIALERRRLGRRIEISFDPIQNPYVGLWLAYGGWPDEKGKRQHCVALEPCTAPVDSLATALERGIGRTLAPGAAWSWKIEVHIVSA
jgi:galactose mutarotase-like enzyme